MGIQIRLKTGFFETGIYRLEVKEKQFRLFPEDPDHGDILSFCEQDILSITLKEKRIPELELQTREACYTATFPQKSDLKETLELVKKGLNTKVICEYEGGN